MSISIITVLAVITTDVAVHRFGGSYGLTEQDLMDPKQPYRALILSSAKANRLKPEFLAAIIAAELSDLGASDYMFDLPGAIVGDASVGVGQIKPSTVAILRPDFGKMKRVTSAFSAKKSITLVAEYLRAVADSSVDQAPEMFWYSGYEVTAKDFQQDSAVWTWQMETVMAYNYTQKAWNIQTNPQTGKKGVSRKASSRGLR